MSFLAGLEDLKHHIVALDLEWELMGTPIDRAGVLSEPEQRLIRLQDHIGKGISKRQFDYNSIVVSLYGFVEQFVETLLRAYIRRINSIVPRYGDLPEAIRNHHLGLSLSLLSRVQQSRFKGSLTPKSIIGNLHSCLSGDTPYTLNADAFSYHTANFRADVIEESLSHVGVANTSQRIRHFSPFAEYVSEQFPARDPNSVPEQELFFFINDLAERRNEVAHGTPTQLLTNDYLVEYIDFCKAYGAALYELVECQVLASEVTGGHFLGKPLAVFDNRIVGIKVQDISVKIGDVLIAETGNGTRPFIGGEIQEMQIDGVPHDIIHATDAIAVGLKVGFKAKNTYRYYLIRRA